MCLTKGLQLLPTHTQKVDETVLKLLGNLTPIQDVTHKFFQELSVTGSVQLKKEFGDYQGNSDPGDAALIRSLILSK